MLPSLLQTSLKSSTAASDMVTVSYELMKKKLEVVDQDYLLFLNWWCIHVALLKGKLGGGTEKKALEMYDLEFILYLNLQDTIVRIKASGSRWKLLL